MDKNKENRHEVSDKELFEQYRKTKDVNIRNEIVSRYLYLAEILAKKFINRGVEYDDLYQVACMALINAVERFDVNANVKFVSFATPTIIGEIKRYFRDKASVIRYREEYMRYTRKLTRPGNCLCRKTEGRRGWTRLRNI